ncbi:MAG: hypothetical protein M9916_05120 [Crocinitomicaceae bacterium]|nr:hypothetical protein [Crocinitomicaceae bacterium]
MMKLKPNYWELSSSNIFFSYFLLMLTLAVTVILFLTIESFSDLRLGDIAKFLIVLPFVFNALTLTVLKGDNETVVLRTYWTKKNQWSIAISDIKEIKMTYALDTNLHKKELAFITNNNEEFTCSVKGIDNAGFEKLFANHDIAITKVEDKKIGF